MKGFLGRSRTGLNSRMAIMIFCDSKSRTRYPTTLLFTPSRPVILLGTRAVMLKKNDTISNIRLLHPLNRCPAHALRKLLANSSKFVSFSVLPSLSPLHFQAPPAQTLLYPADDTIGPGFSTALS